MNTLEPTLSCFPPEGQPVPPAAHSASSGPPRFAPGDNPARRIPELLEKIQSLPNPSARALVQECLGSVLELYGQALARVLELAKGAPAGGARWLEELIEDPLLRSLLLIHGLHPTSLDTRLRAALAKVRPYMQSHGGNVELISLDHDFARLRLQGTCHGCPSSRVTLELAVRKAIEEACPDLAGFEVEGAANGAATE